MTNSTHLGHIHTPESDAIKVADERIILVLGAVVFVTFAIGLACQLYDSSVSFPRSQYWEEEGEDEAYSLGGLNGLSDLEAGNCTAELPLRSAPQPATRYGSIMPYLVDVNGVQKMVLVVDSSPPSDSAQDAYSDWFMGWRQRLEKADSEQQDLDENAALLGDSS